MKKIYLFLFLFCYGNCANILSIFIYPSKSHVILGSTLLKELVKHGHNVTMISPYPLKNAMENYTDIDISDLMPVEKEKYMTKLLSGSKSGSMPNFNSWQITKAIGTFSENVCKHPSVVELLRSETKFDLIIMVWAYTEALLGIAHHYNASVIAFSTKGSTAHTNYVTNNPNPYAYVPNLMYPFCDRMSFAQRVVNTLANFYSESLALYFAYYYQQDILNRLFPDAPSLDELLDSVALVFLNAHHSIETSRPYVPSMIQIGGFHVKEPKQLPQDLQDFLDSATEGAIFFSLGSNLRSSDMPDEKLRQIVRVFANVSQKILWKWEDEHLPERPENVKIGKWLPQNDILAHPNVKAFITHGGLLSTTEAVYHGVPIIGIPFYSDQKTNVGVSVNSGYAIKIAFDELDEETFANGLREIIHNPKYLETARLKSSIMRNQPVKPMDSAIFWVEHVLKHKGAPHLRTAGSKLPWYKLYLVDVAAFMLTTITLAVALILFICKRIYKTIIFYAIFSTKLGKIENTKMKIK